MNLLNFDIVDSIPNIIEAYVEVYGTEYKELITQRISRNFYVIYNDLKDIESYVNFLKDCKQKELAIKFLNEIGIDTSKYKQDNYAEDLDPNINKKIETIIGDYKIIDPIRSIFATKGIFAYDSIDSIKPKEKRQKIQKYRKIFEQILEEYEEYIKQLQPYEEYIQEEKRRESDIQAKKRLILYGQIEKILPNNVKKILG